MHVLRASIRTEMQNSGQPLQLMSLPGTSREHVLRATNMTDLLPTGILRFPTLPCLVCASLAPLSLPTNCLAFGWALHVRTSGYTPHHMRFLGLAPLGFISSTG